MWIKRWQGDVIVCIRTEAVEMENGCIPSTPNSY